MRRLFPPLIPGAVAGVFLTSALVLAQVPKAVGPAREQPAKKQPAAKNAMKFDINIALPRVAAPANAKVVARQRGVLNLNNQLLPVFRMELLYVRTVGRLTKEQLRRIRPEADKMFKETIDQLVDSQPVAVQRKGGMAAMALDPRERIREAVAGVVKRHVTDEQWAAYQADLHRRGASRKEAGIRFLVAALDRQLMLSPEQRAKLTESVSSHWDDAWSSALTLNLYGNTLLPDVPDQFVTPYLSDSQVKVWRGVQKFGGRFWGGGVDPGTDPVVDEELGAEPRAKPVGAATKKGVSAQYGPASKR